MFLINSFTPMASETSKRAFQISSCMVKKKVFTVIIFTLEGIVIVIQRNQAPINMLMRDVSRTLKWSIIAFSNT